MDNQSRERAALLAFFLPLTRQTCEELAVGDQTVSAYLADVLVEFARSVPIFAGLTAYDFQRLRRTQDIRAAPLLAASIFLDILNVFLLLLSLFGRD